MKKTWYWILVVLVGSLPIGSALQYYFAGEPYRNTPTRNWLVVGQVVLGLLIMAFGLYKQMQASREVPPTDEAETKLNLRDEK
jgi:hypothetical protein